MSGAVGPKRPPVGSRFPKGKSGNPKGRPRSQPRQRTSAYEIVLDRTLTVTQGGKERDLTLEEALQLKTYQAAIAGNRAARREVLKMLAKREKWLAAHAPKHRPPEMLTEQDPANANEALLLLGIAEPDRRCLGANDPYERLLLQPWAVQAALSRRGRRKLSEREIQEVKRCTRDPETLRWPRGSDE